MGVGVEDINENCCQEKLPDVEKEQGNTLVSSNLMVLSTKNWLIMEYGNKIKQLLPPIPPIPCQNTKQIREEGEEKSNNKTVLFYSLVSIFTFYPYLTTCFHLT